MKPINIKKNASLSCIKTIIASLAVVATVGFTSAQTTNYVTDGGFDNPLGAAGPWVNFQGGGNTFTFPSTGGNPSGFAQIANTTGAYGILVANNNTAIPLATLGLTAGQTYTFVEDIKIISGTHIGGLKIDFSPGGSTGDMFPSTAGHNTANWETYSFSVTLPANCTGVIVVPEWGANSTVGIDNVGVVIPYSGPIPLTVSITNPITGSTQGNNVTINASASISPGSVTNVTFFDNGTPIATNTSSPYSYAATLLAGAHTLTAIAYANSNSILVTATNTVSITVTDTPPLVVYEPFRYGTGSINGIAATNATGETGSWSAAGANAPVQSGSLAYAGITTSSNKLNVIAGRASVNFVNPIARGGTKWISYLMDMDGNCGANAIGVYLKNGGTGLWVGSGFNGVSSTTGPLYIGTTDTAAAGASGMTPKSPQFTFTYGAIYLVVLKIDFNTGGGNDTVTAFINPTAGTNTPTGYVAAITNNSAINVGTISGFGVQNPGCGNNFVDEVRVADSFGAVVGAPSPTVVTTVVVSTNQATTVSWTAYSTNVYQPQSSPNNSTWSNVGSQIAGNTPNSIVDLANAAFYQILEYYPVTTEVVANGGLDYDTGLTPDTAQNWNGVQSQPPVWINTDGHTALGCLDLAVTNTVAAPNGSEMQQNTLSQGNGVTPGTSYNFSFWAKQISSGPSYVQQYNVQWLGAGSVFLGQSGVANFSGGSGSWAHITQTGIVAPAGAVTALIQILGNTGAVLGGYGEVLIDDVSLTATTLTGGPNILVPTVQTSMSFTATVKTNGITAADAVGTVTFKTNSIQLSVNSVASGVAASAGTSINPPYTVTAIYSGDPTYLGSTGTLTVNGSGPSGPAVLTNSVSGGVLNLSWPAGQGWRLQMQTNSLSVGLGTNWNYVTGTSVSSTNIPVDSTKPTVFYRLTYP